MPVIKNAHFSQRAADPPSESSQLHAAFAQPAPGGRGSRNIQETLVSPKFTPTTR